jgi:hypothetical protein
MRSLFRDRRKKACALYATTNSQHDRSDVASTYRAASLLDVLLRSNELE